MRNLSGIFILVFVLSGCMLVKTKIHPANFGEEKNQLDKFPNGVTYYLPMRLLEVEVSRKVVPKDIIKTTKVAAENAEIALKEAEEKEKAAKIAFENAKKDAEAGSGAGSSRANENADLLERAYKRFKEATKIAKEKFIIAKAAADAAANDPESKKFEDDISITLLPITADVSTLYVTNLQHWWHREDDFKITVNDKGLLTSLDLISTDKTPEIIEKVAQIGIEVAKLTTLAPIPAPAPAPVLVERVSVNFDECGESKKEVGIEKKEFSVKYLVDPALDDEKDAIRKDVVSIESVNQDLCRLKTKFFVTVKKRDGLIGYSPKLINPNTGGNKKYTNHSRESVVDGLLYRREIPYIVVIHTDRGEQKSYHEYHREYLINTKYKDKRKEDWPENVRSTSFYPEKTEEIRLLNEAPITIAEVRAGAFGTSKTSIKFKDGMLLDRSDKNESELLGFVNIPLSIIRSVSSLLTDFFQFKFNSTPTGSD